MEISNNDLARILGNIESTVKSQMESSLRQEAAIAALDNRVGARLDDQERRIRSIEVINPAKHAETLKKHDERLTQLEKNSARAGAIAGLGGSVLIAAAIEYIKSKYR
jgi:hypothetical protein